MSMYMYSILVLKGLMILMTMVMILNLEMIFMRISMTNIITMIVSSSDNWVLFKLTLSQTGGTDSWWPDPRVSTEQSFYHSLQDQNTLPRYRHLRNNPCRLLE